MVIVVFVKLFDLRMPIVASIAYNIAAWQQVCSYFVSFREVHYIYLISSLSTCIKDVKKLFAIESSKILS